MPRRDSLDTSEVSPAGLGLLGCVPDALIGRIIPGERVLVVRRVCKALATKISEHIDVVVIQLKRSQCPESRYNDGWSLDLMPGMQSGSLSADEVFAALMKFPAQTVAVHGLLTRETKLTDSSVHSIFPFRLHPVLSPPLWKLQPILDGLSRAAAGIGDRLTEMCLESANSWISWTSEEGRELMRQLNAVLRQCKSLRRLVIRGNSMGCQNVGMLLCSLGGWQVGAKEQTTVPTTTLTSLDFGSAGIKDVGGDSVLYSKRVSATLAKNTMLTELDLSCNAMGAAGARAFWPVLRNFRQLTSLNAFRVGIDDSETTAACLSALTHCAALTALDLGCNKLVDNGSNALAAALRCWPLLGRLGLEGTEMGAGAMAAAVEALGERQALAGLNWRCNRRNVDAGVVGALQSLLEGATGLRVLDVSESLPGEALIGSRVPDPYYYAHEEAPPASAGGAVPGMLRELRACVEVRRLYLARCDLTDAALEALGEAVGGMRQLELLSVPGAQRAARVAAVGGEHSCQGGGASGCGGRGSGSERVWLQGVAAEGSLMTDDGGMREGAGNKATSQGMRALLAGARGAREEKGGEEGGLRRCWRLELLDVGGNAGVGEKGLAAVAGALGRWRRLRLLRARGCEVGRLSREAARGLAEALGASAALEEVDVSENNMGSEAVAKLLRCVRPLVAGGGRGMLASVRVGCNEIGPGWEELQTEFLRGLGRGEAGSDSEAAGGKESSGTSQGAGVGGRGLSLKCELWIDPWKAAYSRPYGWKPECSPEGVACTAALLGTPQ